MKKKLKKSLSVFLAVVMAITAIPATTYASKKMLLITDMDLITFNLLLIKIHLL